MGRQELRLTLWCVTVEFGFLGRVGVETCACYCGGGIRWRWTLAPVFLCGAGMKTKIGERVRLRLKRLNETTHKSVRKLFLPGGHAHDRDRDRDERNKAISATRDKDRLCKRLFGFPSTFFFLHAHPKVKKKMTR